MASPCICVCGCVTCTVSQNVTCINSTYSQEFEDDNEYGHDFGLTVVKKPRPCSICEDIIWSDAIVCSGKQLQVLEPQHPYSHP